MGLGRRHYLLACMLALGLHLALAAVLLWRPAPPQGQAMAAGTGGIEISLGPAGRVTDSPESREEEEMDALEPEPVPEPIPEPEPTPEPEPQPEPVPQPVPEPASEPRAEQPVPAVAQAAVAGAAGHGSTRDADETGSGDTTAGGGLPGASQDYAATLLAWLERHKQYPRRARLRRQEGTVWLYLVVDRGGAVLEYRLERSSGHPALDEEVLAMIERAQPLPPMPEDTDREHLELIVPVEFFLR
jgi:periplasmic protein TonB